MEARNVSLTGLFFIYFLIKKKSELRNYILSKQRHDFFFLIVSFGVRIELQMKNLSEQMDTFNINHGNM